MLDSLPTSLPALTALATLIAAGIGAVVAVVVAYVNAWSARRIAIDNAHRVYRQDLAAGAVGATRALLTQMHRLDQLALFRNVDGWCKEVARMVPSGRRLKADLRRPHDPVFAAAITLFTQRRTQLEMWLSIAGRQKIPEVGLTVANDYIREAAEIVQVSAEAYVFDAKAARKRAQRLLKEVDPTALKRRIDARLAIYDAAFSDEDDEIELP